MSAAVANAAASTMPERTPYALNAPLPYAGDGDRWLRYARYPAFGGRWLLGRCLVFGACIGGFGALTSASLAVATGDGRTALLSGLHFFVGFMLMSSAGPSLATLVRHARWPLKRERMLVVAALLVGVVIAYFADSWASGYLESAIPESKSIELTLKPPPLTPLETAAAAALKLLMGLLIYGALGGGLALRAYFRELGRWQASVQAEAMAALQAEKQRSDLRLGVLQAQVEPHFLFNTLASVRASVRQAPAQAEATLDALVAYLRASIPKLRDDEAALVSTLGQQLDLCAHYLEVMRLRTAGRLRYAIHADAASRASSFPSFLLLSLVENAVKHGVEPKLGTGTVTLSAEREDGALRVRVDDDGLGLRTGTGGGLGLTNLRAQLRTLYGERASFRIESGADGGTRAELRIPMEDAAT